MKFKTKTGWSGEWNGRPVLAGTLDHILPAGNPPMVKRTYVLKLDKPFYGHEYLTFDPEDLELINENL